MKFTFTFTCPLGNSARTLVFPADHERAGATSCLPAHTAQLHSARVKTEVTDRPTDGPTIRFEKLTKSALLLGV
jgi:hypothetical protein